MTTRRASFAARSFDSSQSVQQTVATAALHIILSALMLEPSAAHAKAIMTPDERVAIDIYKQATKSVVNVSNFTLQADQFTMNMTEFPQGKGSGFIYDTQGHVVTNFHVVADAVDVKVTLSGGEEYDAKVVGVDRDKDVAVLQLLPQRVTLTSSRIQPDNAFKIEPSLSNPLSQNNSPYSPAPALPPSILLSSDAIKGLPFTPVKPLPTLTPLPICKDDSPLQVGQKVFAIGNPFGMDQTLTVGVVSGTGREINGSGGRPIQDVIQTDAAINPGNSGGPLIDTSGCVIGVNTAIYSTSGANTGVGFAIPAEVVRNSVEQIVANGRVVRPWLGLAFAPDQSSEVLGVKGILVLNAKDGGPASKAGLRGSSRDAYGRLVLGDVIVGLNGKEVANSNDLYRVLNKSKAGETLDLEVLRENAKEHINVVLENNETA